MITGQEYIIAIKIILMLFGSAVIIVPATEFLHAIIKELFKAKVAAYIIPLVVAVFAFMEVIGFIVLYVLYV